MVILIFWIGVYPDTFLGYMHASVSHLLERVNTGSGPAIAAAGNVVEILK